jgi:hypothetical protein
VAERVAGEEVGRRHLCARRRWSFIGLRLGEILLAIFRERQIDATHVESRAKQYLLDETAIVAAVTTSSAASISSSGRIATIAAACVHGALSER